MICPETTTLPERSSSLMRLPDDVQARCARPLGHLATEKDDGHVGTFAHWIIRW